MADVNSALQTKGGRVAEVWREYVTGYHAKVTATKEDGYAWTSTFGVSNAAVVSADASTAVAVTDAPTTGQYIVVDSVTISAGSALTIDLESETGAVKFLQLYMAANTSFEWKPRGKVKLAVVNKKLMVKASGAGNVTVSCCYHSEA